MPSRFKLKRLLKKLKSVGETDKKGSFYRRLKRRFRKNKLERSWVYHNEIGIAFQKDHKRNNKEEEDKWAEDREGPDY